MTNTFDSYTRQVFELAAQTWVPIVIALAAMTAPYVYLDMYHSEREAPYYLVDAILTVVEYLLLITFVRTLGVMPKGETGRIGTFFFVYLASAVLAGLGLIALVIPGLFLIVRLVPALAAAVAGKDDIVGTIKWSWRATEDVQWRIARALLGPFLCLMVVVGAILHWELVYLEVPEVWTAYEWGSTLMINSSSAVMMIWLSALGAVVYRDIRGQRGEAGTGPLQNPT